MVYMNSYAKACPDYSVTVALLAQAAGINTRICFASLGKTTEERLYLKKALLTYEQYSDKRAYPSPNTKSFFRFADRKPPNRIARLERDA